MKYNKGFVGIGIVIAIIIALVVGGGVVYYATKTKVPSTENTGVNNYQPVEQNYVPPTSYNNNQQTQTPPQTNQQQATNCNSITQPYVEITSPNNNASYHVGDTIKFKWKICNIPQGSILSIASGSNTGSGTISQGQWYNSNGSVNANGFLDPFSSSATLKLPTTVCGGECGPSENISVGSPYHVVAYIDGPLQPNGGRQRITTSNQIYIAVTP